MEEILYCDIKTSLSGVFFEDVDDDRLFLDWMNDTLNAQNIVYEGLVIDNPLPNIDRIAVVVDSLTDLHELTVSIDAESSVDYGTLVNDTEFNKYVEGELIPQFINVFNSQCNITYPTTRNDNFKWMKFDGDDFYTKVYFSDSNKQYMKVDIKESEFYLINDFELAT